MDIEKIKSYDWVLIVSVILLVIAFANFMFVLQDVAEYRKFTGYDVETGKANLSVESEANIEFYVNGTDWGSGAVNSSIGDTATIDTEGNVSAAGTWSANNQPLVLHNIGNTNVNVSLSANNTAEEFIGSQDASTSYQVKVSENETGACSSITNFVSYGDMPTTDTQVCSSLDYSSSTNSLNFDIELVIPSDAEQGSKASIITATGTSV